MQHGDEEDADTQDTQDPLAALIIEKQRNNVTKGTQQVYDC
jgi:replicative DNA helicase